MLRERAQSLVERCPLVVASAVMRGDGATLTQSACGPLPPLRELNEELLGVIEEVCKAGSVLKLGALHEMMIQCDGLTYLLHVPLRGDEILCLVLDPAVDPGGGQRELRRILADLHQPQSQDDDINN